MVSMTTRVVQQRRPLTAMTINLTRPLATVVMTKTILVAVAMNKTQVNKLYYIINVRKKYFKY